MNNMNDDENPIKSNIIVFNSLFYLQLDITYSECFLSFVVVMLLE